MPRILPVRVHVCFLADRRCGKRVDSFIRMTREYTSPSLKVINSIASHRALRRLTFIIIDEREFLLARTYIIFRLRSIIIRRIAEPRQMNMIMQPSSSTASSHSTLYNSRRTILELEDLSSATSRCRSSIISSVDAEHIPHLPSPSDRFSCRPFFHRCLSSSTSRLSHLMQKKLADSLFRKQYFARLCRHHRPLLVLNDYHCPCGCRFAMRQGSFVLLDDKPTHCSSLCTADDLVGVISNQLMCSRVPWTFLCDLRSLRERVRTRSFYSRAQSFDL